MEERNLPAVQDVGGVSRKRRAGNKTTRYGNGAGSGPGWGGSAKGASAAQPQVLHGVGPGRGHVSKDGEARREREQRHAEEMRELYYEVATNPEEPTPNRLAAATHLLNRIEGQPVAKLVTASLDPIAQMSRQELKAELQRQRKLVKAFMAAKRDDRE